MSGGGDRVLVTGGTGFVGGLLLARLVAEGRQVRALIRRPADREQLPDPRVELALGDIRDEESLVRAADGCAVVYHLAGVNQLCLPDPAPLYLVNVEGTRRMLQAARRVGVRRVVHTSSAATLGGDGTREVDESAGLPAEFTSHYARSKFESEQLALAFDGVEVVAVNPSSVQGPGRTTGTAKVFIGYLNGRLPFDLPARFGLCYTEDCVNGHLLAEAKGRPGQRYVLNTATVSNAEAMPRVRADRRPPAPVRRLAGGAGAGPAIHESQNGHGGHRALVRPAGADHPAAATVHRPVDGAPRSARGQGVPVRRGGERAGAGAGATPVTPLLETDVVVAGGGATGVAVLRDLALRGVNAVLVERFDLGTGTSGRWHGLLHSGARYAVRDQESARECIEENTVLRRIAPHTVEDIGGLFVLLPGDDEAYAGKFVQGCLASGIPTEELSAAEARRREPLLAPDVKLAFAVPDGGIDSWALLRSMAADAEARGSRVLVRHPVVGVERDGDRITAVRVHDQVAGEDRLIGCQWVVNAAGAWAGEIGRMAGVPIRMIAGKGVMVVMASRYVRGVVNACRKPADGDIIVPQHEVAILGTTSEQVQSPDDIAVPPAHVDRMVDMCAQMVPAIASGRVLRAFAGSRPLYQPESADGDGAAGGGDTRAVTRTVTVL